MTRTPSKPNLNWPNSLWRVTADAGLNFGRLEESIETDLLIVGAGYTGLSTALHAIEKTDDVVIIDQAQPGWGCSGRNGGQVHPQWKSELQALKGMYPGDQFNSFIQTLEDAADLVFKLIDEHQIDCQAKRNGSIIAGRGSKAIRYLTQWSQFWAEEGKSVHLLDREKTSEVIGTSRYDLSMCDDRGGSLQPLAYSRGLARACSQHGVSIFGDTCAKNISQTTTGWRVITDAGDIRCKRLVLATNGYTDGLWPGLARTIIPVASMLSATHPLPGHVASTILPGRQVAAEYAGVPAYYRVDEKNRLVFGWRGTLSGKIGGLKTAHLRAKALRLFPQISGTRWEYDWAGYVGVTPHQRPMLLKLSDNVYAGLGYNGRGVPMATMMGKQLALALNNEPTAIAIDAPRTVPLHSFYPVGVYSRIVSGHIFDRIR